MNDRVELSGVITSEIGLSGQVGSGGDFSAVVHAVPSNGLSLDKTLTQRGFAADAQSVGERLSDKVDGAYLKGGHLYLTSDGKDLVGPLGPFLSGASIISAHSLIENNVLSVSGEDSANLHFSWVSKDLYGVVTGDGTARIFINGVLRSIRDHITQGTVQLDVSGWLNTGENKVDIEILDRLGGFCKLEFMVHKITLEIFSSFDDCQALDGDLNFRYTVNGVGEKTVHFELEGDELGVQHIAGSGRLSEFLIAARPHGAYNLKVWAERQVNGVAVRSNVLRYHLLWIDEENHKPIVASVYDQFIVDEGDAISIHYAVWSPDSDQANVSLIINGDIVGERVCDRQEHIWNLRANQTGQMLCGICCGETTREIPLEVQKVDTDVRVTSVGLMVELLPEGKSNDDPDGRDHWENRGVCSEFSGFYWVNNGWMLDEAENACLRIDNGAVLSIPVFPFAEDRRNEGLTIEIDYKAKDVRSPGEDIFRCIQGNIGFTVNDREANFYVESTQLSTHLKAEERTHLVFAVESRSQNRFIMIYVNGVLSAVTQYSEFDSLQHGIPKGISFGAEGCCVDLYSVRVYDRCLQADEILGNFMSNQNVNAKKDIYLRNRIMGQNGEPLVSEVSEMIPVVTLIGRLPLESGDKRIISLQMLDKADGRRNLVSRNVMIDRTGSNDEGFHISLPHNESGYAIHEGQKETRYFELLPDRKDSSGMHRTCLGEIIKEVYEEPIPSETDDMRFSGTPVGRRVALFWQDEELSPQAYLGCYSFMSDQREGNALGMLDSVNHQCWEMMNSYSDRCLFLTDRALDDTDGADIALRYPEQGMCD